MPRGKKQCPQCETLVGPRLAVCQCGHEFTFKAGKTPIHRKAKAKATESVDLTENPSEVIGVNDRDALQSFIEQLKDCQTAAKDGCSCYSAFLYHRHGVLQVEICFPLRVRR